MGITNFIEPPRIRMFGIIFVASTQNLVAEQKHALEVSAQRKWLKSVVNTITRQAILNNRRKSF